MPKNKPQDHAIPNGSDLLKKLRALAPPQRSAALREGLLAATSVGDADAAAPLAWALVELAALPATRIEGPVWNPLRWWTEHRIKGSDAALSAIAASWTTLSEDVRKAAMGVGEDRWEFACRSALRDGRPAVRINVATLVAQSGEVALASLASELLADPLDGVARQAELTLVALAVQARRARWSQGEQRAWDHARETSELWGPVLRPTSLRTAPRADELLSLGLSKALESFQDHRRRGVLLSVILLCDRGFVRGSGGAGKDARKELLRVIESREHTANGPLMSMLRARALPMGRLRALEWLHLPAARRGAAARLARAEAVWDHELVLSAAHLCLRPARKDSLRGVTVAPRAKAASDGGALPSHAVTRALSVSARRMLPLWSSSINAPAPLRHTALGALLGDEDPVARLSAVGHGPGSLLCDRGLDGDARVCRSECLAWGGGAAARRTATPDADRSRLLALFSRLPHPTVRTLASMDRAHDADPFSPALAVASPEGVATAYRALASGRTEFITELGTRLALGSSHTWAGAIHLARRLLLVPEVEGLLRDIVTKGAGSADVVRAVAQAVSALGDSTSQTALLALRDATTHADARIRANAVEALAKHLRLARGLARANGSPMEAREQPSPFLFELKDDPHHRVRANALRAVIIDASADPAVAAKRPKREDRITESKPSGSLNAAAESLASMLSDDRTMHRLAGTWLAWKTLGAGGQLRLHAHWPDLVTQVGDIARKDPEPKVRLRAARCAQMVESSMSVAAIQTAARSEGLLL